MDASTEIRKLTPSQIRELAKTLDYGDSWKRIMAIIPNNLYKDNYECSLTRDNLPKYHSEHFKLIENASANLRRSCTQILFDEWGTSGKVRPSLGHLLYLLIKAELFKAADYVAIDLLKREPPLRPKDGPAAKVIITLPDLDVNHKIVNKAIINEEPSITIQQNLNDHNVINKNPPQKLVLPKLIVTECREDKRIFHEKVVRTKSESAMIKFSEAEVSDMMKFSDNYSYSLTDVPDISALLNQSSETDNTSAEIDNAIAETSQPTDKATAESVKNVSSYGNNDIIQSFNADEANIPQLSALICNTFETNQNFSNLLNSNDVSSTTSDNIPNLSILNGSIVSSQVSLPNLSIINGGNSYNNSNLYQYTLPEVLINSNSEVTNMDSIEQNNSSLRSKESGNSQGSTRPNCHSPLPNLSLNTLLPHFAYNQIEIATNNFDAVPHLSVLDMNDGIIEMEKNGRFLGSGAFGSVYLATGLCDNSVAVKKLHLHDVAVVNIDDTVTKQFKNEVEVLSKYKHPNLLSLIGYSCDGPTYCLLYEYISGGALNERLQKNKELLTWKDRLNIAFGTANAVCYLHTAFDIPLIHRDIKSANILLDCTKKPKLCDFGLIKLTPNQNTITSTSVFGTSAYMAPEAFRGDISVKLDTFSFGVVVLELLTGLPTLDGNRDGCDIVTHVADTCEDDKIEPLLDIFAGNWMENDTQFGQLLFEISLQCLEDKKKRPTMVEVSSEMEKLVQKCS